MYEGRFLSLAVRNTKTDSLVTASSLKSTNGELYLPGMLTDPSEDAVAAIRLLLPMEAVQNLSLDEHIDRIAVMDESGNETGYEISNLSIDRVLDKNYEVWSGLWFARSDHPVSEFVAVVNPDPIWLVAAVAAAACIGVIGAAKIFNRCAERMQEAISACSESKGIPSIVNDVTFGLSLKPFQLGCHVRCRVECHMSDGSVRISSEEKKSRPADLVD